MAVSCHRPFLPGTSLEPAVSPTAQASSFTPQCFPIIIIIIIIIINCNWVVTRWQWLFYMYTKHEIGYY